MDNEDLGRAMAESSVRETSGLALDRANDALFLIEWLKSRIEQLEALTGQKAQTRPELPSEIKQRELAAVQARVWEAQKEFARMATQSPGSPYAYRGLFNTNYGPYGGVYPNTGLNRKD